LFHHIGNCIYDIIFPPTKQWNNDLYIIVIHSLHHSITTMTHPLEFQYYRNLYWKLSQIPYWNPLNIVKKNSFPVEIGPNSNGWFQLWAKFWSRQEERNHYHSWNEHLKMSKIAKFGCEITILEPKAVILYKIYTKFANFTGLYFPHFTTIRNQTLQFYSF
jgi:hypothetical protein